MSVLRAPLQRRYKNKEALNFKDDGLHLPSLNIIRAIFTVSLRLVSFVFNGSSSCLVVANCIECMDVSVGL